MNANAIEQLDAAPVDVAAAAEETLHQIERVSGGPVPGLRRQVGDALAARHGDAVRVQAEAARAVLRPVLHDLAASDQAVTL